MSVHDDQTNRTRKPVPADAPSSREELIAGREDLIAGAKQNERILRRYQDFELRMLSANDFAQLLHILLEATVEHFRLDAVELLLCDPQEAIADAIPDAFEAHPDLQLVKRERAVERLYATPAQVQLVSKQQGGSIPVFKGKGISSAAMLPLHRKGRFVGALHFGAYDSQRFTPDKSTDFMAHMASIISVCIENALSQEHLRRLSMLDMLTRVNNRRGFHLALDREVSRASRSGEPLCLLFVDLDHFKTINDSYGHPMGDKVLRVVAHLLRDTLRRVDHVCRYGGEEFALVLPNCSQSLAMDIAERLRRRVSQLRIEVDDDNDQLKEKISVTLSMGVCCWQPDRRIGGDEEKRVAEVLIARSDRGVYECKANGRNTVRYVAFEAA